MTESTVEENKDETGRETVLEVKVSEAKLTLHLPLEAGEDLAAAVEQGILDGDVRGVNDAVVEQAYKMEKY